MSLFIQAAHAAPETAGAAGLFGQILLPVAFFAIFYFLVIRPQSKRTKEHRAMVNALKNINVIGRSGALGGEPCLSDCRAWEKSAQRSRFQTDR